MSNVWIRDLAGRLIRADQITGTLVGRVEGLGWTVIAQTATTNGDVEIADFGRFGKARNGAEVLSSQLPAVMAAAAVETDGSAYTISFVPGHRKGLGEWATVRGSGRADAAALVGSETVGGATSAARSTPVPSPTTSASAAAAPRPAPPLPPDDGGVPGDPSTWPTPPSIAL